tara:strand:+ start:322 stop:471 length:150 start_codon:yes stop_codon:yes gene_type:complete
MDYQKFLENARKRIAPMLAMRAKGATFAEIGKRFGITAQRAQKILKDAK